MTNIADVYRLLFGRSGTNKASDVDIAEHGRVGGVSTGQPFKFVQNIESVPTDPTKTNPSITISNVDEVVTYTKIIVKTIGGVEYSKTLSFNASDELLSMTEWTI